MHLLSKLLKQRFARSGHQRNTSKRKTKSRFLPRIEVLEPRQLMAADVILEWNEVLLAANAADHSGVPQQGGPILTARAFAIVSGAMYDAYNSIERIGAPFLIRANVNGKTDNEAAVAQAAHDTLVALFPAQTPRFDAALNETLARVSNGAAEDRGRALGAKVAQHILLDRKDDGAAELTQLNAQYQPKGLPGFHNVDPINPLQGFYASGAMHVSPFVIEDLDQFAARQLDDGTPAGRLRFMQSAEYKAAYDEVFALGGDGITSATSRTPEQTQIGIFWAYDGRPGLGTPPRLYNQIARTIAIQQKNSVPDNARLFALINIGLADAGLTAWNDKYGVDFWRPILGIRQGDVDGNSQTTADANWSPLGALASNPRPGEKNFTPPFPAYTSGHATFGAAALQTLARFYGRDNIQFSFVSDELNGITRDVNGNTRPVVSRTFNKLSEAKFENAHSRIYLGIHWAFDCDDGIKTGDATANFIFDNVLQPKTPANHALRHNTFDPMDVNDDGGCTPLDALIVINMINAGMSESPDYVDVNNDKFASALDALLIINVLNQLPPNQPEAEGEQSGKENDADLPWVTIESSRGIDSFGKSARSWGFIATYREDFAEIRTSRKQLDGTPKQVSSEDIPTDTTPRQVAKTEGISWDLFVLAVPALFDNLTP